MTELEQAISAVTNATPAKAPWTTADFSNDPANEPEIDAHIATILNAVATGQLVPAPAWQPISTAPKDGTPIITLTTGCTATEAVMVMWWEAKNARRVGYGWAAYEVSHMLAPEFWLPLPAGPADGGV